MNYSEKLDQARTSIKSWQNEHTGSTDINLSKGQSQAMIKEVCPWCEYREFCGDVVCRQKKNISLIKCHLRSWDLTTVWVRVSDDRPEVKIGDRYGKLVVVNRRHYIAKPFWPDKLSYWVCRCDCGNITIARGDKLVSGMKRSCGSNQCRYNNDISSHTGGGKESILGKNKKSRYSIGSDINPDKTRHKYPSEHHSRIGCKIETLIEIKDPKTNKKTKTWVTKRCDECGGIIRYDRHYAVCEKCGLVS